MAESLKHKLKVARLREILQPQNICILRDSASVDSALRTLAGRRILSAPVVSASEDGEECADEPNWPQDKSAPNILGFVDIRDILASFLKELDVSAVVGMKMLSRMRVLEDKGNVFCKRPLGTLPVLGSDGSFLHTNAERCTLLELIFTMVNAKANSPHEGTFVSEVVHRIAVFDNDSKITHIVSQSDIVRYIVEHAHDTSGVLQMQLGELGFCPKEVVSVTADESAFRAMALMSEHGISAVAVVGEDKALVGNFSISEMRTIMCEHFGSLALPVAEFLALEHGTEYAGYIAPESRDSFIAGASGERNKVEDAAAAAVEAVDGQAGIPEDAQAFARDRTRRLKPGVEVGQNLVLAKAETSLLEAMQSCISSGIHRLYIVDSELQPIGVVTLTDMLRAVCGDCKP